MIRKIYATISNNSLQASNQRKTNCPRVPEGALEITTTLRFFRTRRSATIAGILPISFHPSLHVAPGSNGIVDMCLLCCLALSSVAPGARGGAVARGGALHTREVVVVANLLSLRKTGLFLFWYSISGALPVQKPLFKYLKLIGRLFVCSKCVFCHALLRFRVQLCISICVQIFRAAAVGLSVGFVSVLTGAVAARESAHWTIAAAGVT